MSCSQIGLICEHDIQNTSVIFTGLSDCHGLILSCLRAHFNRLPHKQITYRSYKNFNKNEFIRDLDHEIFGGTFYQHKEPPKEFSEVFMLTLDKHTPLKQRKMRGNQAPFMTKTLSKAIMDRSGIRNRYLRWPSRENFLEFKKAKRLCNSQSKKTKKDHFKAIAKNGITSIKDFWNVVKPFLTNKCSISNDFISIKNGGEIINDENLIVEILNNHYIDIVEKTSGNEPSSVGNTYGLHNNFQVVIKLYQVGTKLYLNTRTIQVV